MAQGRGNANAAAMLLIMVGLQICCLWHQASAAIHTVGGSKGWDIGVDYTTWAAGESFKAGDILFFPYPQSEHNVVVVDKAGYDACSEANAVTTYSEGNTNVTLTGAGAHYYLCSVVGHCSAGMKLAVTVTATATSPSVSPVAVPSASPPTTAPAPSKAAPAPAPSKATPSPAPSPTSTPSSSPAPAPASMETPAPVPSPSSAPTPAGTPASSPSAPGSTPSTAGTPPSSPPPPNAAPFLSVSAAFAPLTVLFAALFAL